MIIQVHIHKTAGSSLTGALRANYSKDIPIFDLDFMFEEHNFNPASRRRSNLSLIDFSSAGTEEVGYINLEQDKLKTAKALAGHVTYNVHKYIPGAHEFHYISLVRSPFDRVFNYCHLMSEPVQCDLNRLGHIMFDQCRGDLSLMMDMGNLPEFHNDQSRMLLGVDKSVKFTFHDVLEHIRKNYFYVGCTEMYAKTLKHLGGLLNWQDTSDPGFSPYEQYTGSDGKLIWDKLLGYSIPQDLTTKIIEYNSVDQKVWEHIHYHGPEGYWKDL